MRNARRNPTRRMFIELKQGTRFKLKHPAGKKNRAGSKIAKRISKALGLAEAA